MSAISSTSGSSLYTFVQSLTQSAQTSGTTAASSTSSTDPTASTNSAATTSDASQGVQGHHHHHGHGGAGKSEFFQQLQQTVTSALQSAQQNGTNPNQAIKDAIAKVFQNNNAASTPATANGTATTADPDAAHANTPASTTTGAATDGSSGNSSLQAFFQTLQSFGVDPQQFHQDFLNAAQGSQNGIINPGAAFTSFPPGSLVDVTG